MRSATIPLIFALTSSPGLAEDSRLASEMQTGAGHLAADSSAGNRRSDIPVSDVPVTDAPLLDVHSRIVDLLGNPAFNGFARRILPWDDRPYDQAMPLSQIESLLPYHSNVVPDTVVAALNRMIADANAGSTIFYDFYSQAEMTQDPSKAETGLFFFRGRPGEPVAVVAPGGGFAYVGSVHEGFPYAIDINARGYNAFVVKYRVGQGGQIATQDLAAALSFIFHNAGILGVGLNDYSLWGSSAGARMAAYIGSHGTAAFGGDALPGPAAVVMAYTAHSDIATREPATFIAVGEKDGIAPQRAMESRADALRRLGTPVEFRSYRGLGHGFGTGAGTVAEGWIGDAVGFWERQMTQHK